MYMRWRTRRKLLYTTIVLLPLIVIVGAIYYSTFFPEPTCFDGVQNQDERGVDCGGSCERVCQTQTSSATISWDRAFNASDDIYNLVAYIENPNVSLEARNVPYSFKLYDEDNLLIADRRGQMRIPPQPVTAVFEPGVETDGREVSRTTFQFLESPFWEQASNPDVNFRISNKTLSGATSSSPRLTLDVTNTNLRRFEDIGIVSIVSNQLGEAVQASKTVIEELEAGETASTIFTWRQPFPTRSVACTNPLDVVLLIDRSGSMDDENQNPPQPLLAVKQAATDFVDLLETDVRSGLVTFATEATDNQSLTTSHDRTLAAVNNINIRTSEGGSTNLGAAINEATSFLTVSTSATSSSSQDEREKIMVMLTDGKVNAPENPGGQSFARSAAEAAKEAGVQMYTIGLGESVDHSFLQEIASEDGRHFQAVDQTELQEVYSNVREDLCPRAPYITETIPTTYQPAN